MGKLLGFNRDYRESYKILEERSNRMKMENEIVIKKGMQYLKDKKERKSVNSVDYRN